MPGPLETLQWERRRKLQVREAFRAGMEAASSSPVDPVPFYIACADYLVPAQRRLIFEDFFVFQSGLALRRHENAQVRKSLVCKVDDRIRESARAVLPFKLTVHPSRKNYAANFPNGRQARNLTPGGKRPAA